MDRVKADNGIDALGGFFCQSCSAFRCIQLGANIDKSSTAFERAFDDLISVSVKCRKVEMGMNVYALEVHESFFRAASIRARLSSLPSAAADTNGSGDLSWPVRATRRGQRTSP